MTQVVELLSRVRHELNYLLYIVNIMYDDEKN